MALKIIAVGELKGWAQLAYSDYEKRLRTPFSVKLIEIPTKDKALEAKKMLPHLTASDYLIALDPKGKRLTSEEVAHHIDGSFSKSLVPTFIIGGPDGIDQSILQRTHAMWSLSDLIMPHPLARIVLIEQIYRAYTILNKHPYHRA